MISAETLKQQAGRAPYIKRLYWQTNGREFRATCPWHTDKNPSLTNYQKDGTWLFSCFPCGKHGDVISFVMAHDGVSFQEAMQRIKDENGITEQRIAEKRAEFRAFKYSADIAIKALQENTEALAYLASRGIPADLAKSQKLGLVDYPGIGAAIAIPYRGEVVKFRALHPPSKDDKFRHVPGHPSKDLLYGIDDICLFDSHVFVVESELDCLTMKAHGFAAVSVSSATTCMQKGELIIQDLQKLQADRKVFLALDQDAAGFACAEAFEKILPAHQTFRLEWEYKKDSAQPKDIGEIYAQNPDRFYERVSQLTLEAENRPPKWRQQFKTVGQLDSGGVQMLVEGFMPEGTSFIGALSGHGKTLLGLSLAKALTTGNPFLGVFPIPHKIPVLYLIPESSGRAFRNRLQKFQIPDDEKLFLCRTLSDGPTLLLNDPAIREAVRQMRPVVILDTAIRFSQAESENDAIENQQLVNDIIALRTSGAAGVIGIHHSKKSSGEEKMSLENVLRGTGDLGAMCDAVYGVRRDEALYNNGRGPNQIEVTCVKPRDFEPPIPFRVMATYRDEDGQIQSLIDEHGDLGMADGYQRKQTDVELVVEWIRTNKPQGCSREVVKKEMKGLRANRKVAAIREALASGKLVEQGDILRVPGAASASPASASPPDFPFQQPFPNAGTSGNASTFPNSGTSGNADFEFNDKFFVVN